MATYPTRIICAEYDDDVLKKNRKEDLLLSRKLLYIENEARVLDHIRKKEERETLRSLGLTDARPRRVRSSDALLLELPPLPRRASHTVSNELLLSNKPDHRKSSLSPKGSRLKFPNIANFSRSMNCLTSATPGSSLTSSAASSNSEKSGMTKSCLLAVPRRDVEERRGSMPAHVAYPKK